MGLQSIFKFQNTTPGYRFVKLLLKDRNRSTILDSRRWAIMGKKTGNADDGTLRHIKYREKIGNNLTVPGSIELVTVGNGSGGTPKGLIVNMSHFKYLFNCGEGTQRIASEHKMKLSRIEQIFLTHNSWENVGGLMGFCLTLESAGVPKVTLHGPPNAEGHVTLARSFAQLRSLELAKREVTEGDYEDSAMKVEYIPIFSSDAIGATASCEPSPAKRPRLSSGTLTKNDMSVIYVCKPHPKQRTVSLEKCVDLNVPVGPHLALLKALQEVTLPDGRLVKPDDVLLPAEVCNPFLVVDCPSEAYFESLVTNVDIRKYQANDPTLMPALVVHFTPALVFKSSTYQEWMNRFGPETKHLVLNDLGSDVATEAIYEIQAKLNLLHPRIFPLLPHQTKEFQTEATRTDENIESVVYGQTNLRYVYRGKDARHFNWQDCVRLNNDVFIKEIMEETEFVESLSKVQQDLQQVQDSSTDSSNYPEILFLGTGSAIPNKVRNVSAVWINMTKDASMLLDCGENTFGQLYRHYYDETPEMLRRLKAVFVSHLHADHHLGLIGMALERYKRLRSTQSSVEPLIVLAPGRILNWYETLHSTTIPIMNLVRVIPLEKLYTSNRDKFQLTYDSLMSALQLKEVNPVRVLHRQFPHGLVLAHKNGWKLTYSGDTMPSTDLIEAGQGSDILIHEATMEDTLVDDAADKRHSTTSQAIDVGMKMNARFILLTHFSQRYAKVPVFNDSFSSRVGIAFDNMKVRLQDLHLLPLFAPVLKSMFADDYMEMEQKTEKKKRQKDRKQNEAQPGKSDVSVSSATQQSTSH